VIASNYSTLYGTIDLFLYCIVFRIADTLYVQFRICAEFIVVQSMKNQHINTFIVLSVVWLIFVLLSLVRRAKSTAALARFRRTTSSSTERLCHLWRRYLFLGTTTTRALVNKIDKTDVVNKLNVYLWKTRDSESTPTNNLLFV
jgi:thiosulfate reductase cytochrome b subunit